MAYTGAYTLEEAREYLTLWKDCERALATGQAKAYRVGSREFTAFDLDEVAAQIARSKNSAARCARRGLCGLCRATCKAGGTWTGKQNPTGANVRFFYSAQSARRKPTRSG